MGYYVEVDNKKKDEQEQKVIDLRTNIEKLFKDAAAAESAGWENSKKQELPELILTKKEH